MHETHGVKVKRDGPRGWHWIDRSKYDPAVHELVDAEQAPAAPESHEAAGQKLEDLSVEALKELAAAKGLAFRANASKPKLIELLNAGG